jgi:hypothetical protein
MVTPSGEPTGFGEGHAGERVEPHVPRRAVLGVAIDPRFRAGARDAEVETVTIRVKTLVLQSLYRNCREPVGKPSHVLSAHISAHVNRLGDSRCQTT